MEKFRYTEVRVFFYLHKLQFKQSNFVCTEHPGLTKNAYHTIFIYEKNAYHTLSYNFIE